MSRLLLDMGLPRRAASDLRELGHDVAHAAERGMATATDLEILDVARNEGRIVVTLDRDFTNLLALERSASPSVIYLRLTGLDRDRSVHAILDVLGRVPDADGPGYVAVVSATGIRVRLLPI